MVPFAVAGTIPECGWSLSVYESTRRKHATHGHRLAHHGSLPGVRTGYRVLAQAVDSDEHRFLSFRTINSRLGLRVGVYFGELGRSGSHWDGRVGRQIRDRD